MRTFQLCMLFVLAGCGAINVNGFKLDQGIWNRDQELIRRRASYDMQCPEEELSLEVLTAQQRCALQVIVRGCGQEGLYVDPNQNYVWVPANEALQ